MLTYNSQIGKSDSNIFHFTAFASDLYNDVPDLKQGFPRIINTSMGNGQPFIAKSKKVDADGDIMYVRYYQQLGCLTLLIYND